MLGEYGTAGEVKVLPETERPAEFVRLQRFIIFVEEGGKLFLEIESAGSLKANLLRVKFRGIDSRESASALKGMSLYVEETDLPALEEGEYYFFELVGCKVELENGEYVGKLSWIERLPGQDLFHIEKDDGTEILLPAVSEFILKILREQKKIIVKIPQGLM